MDPKVLKSKQIGLLRWFSGRKQLLIKKQNRVGRVSAAYPDGWPVGGVWLRCANPAYEYRCAPFYKNTKVQNQCTHLTGKYSNNDRKN